MHSEHMTAHFGVRKGQVVKCAVNYCAGIVGLNRDKTPRMLGLPIELHCWSHPEKEKPTLQ